MLAFFILYLILKKDDSYNDFNFYENFSQSKKFEVEAKSRKKEFENTKIKGLTLETKFRRPLSKPQKYDKYFDDLRKSKPLSITYEDPLYGDVKTYENDHISNTSGLEKCLEKCDGLCLEYGQTGIAHCFPNPKGKIVKSSFYEALRDKSYKTENYNERSHNLKFPNLR
jgi:hypothetical protein